MNTPVIIGNATLYLGDCREILPTLPKVDAVITDPPYGIEFQYEGRDDKGADLRIILHQIKKANIPFAMLMYPEEMMRQVVPITGAPVECLAWCYPSNLKRQFRLWGLWNITADFSKVKQIAKNPERSKVKELYVDSYDWWEQPQVKNVSEEKTEHPCQIPVTMIERLLKLTDVRYVVDPFMGSGTTGVACMNLGRKFIGIEIEERYFSIAVDRITNAQRQQRMFA